MLQNTHRSPTPSQKRLAPLGGPESGPGRGLPFARRSLVSGFTTVAGALLASGAALAGSCTGDSAALVCAGPAGLDTSQNFFDAISVSIVTEPGFGISTELGNAFDITSGGILSFQDENDSAITGAASGIVARKGGRSPLEIRTTGTVEGLNGHGIEVSSDVAATGMTLDAGGDVKGSNTGISILVEGGFSMIATSGEVTGTSAYGIWLDAGPFATSVDINASGPVSGGKTGIFVESYGSGDLTIRASDEVTGATEFGIEVVSAGNAKNVTIEAAGPVIGRGTGITSVSQSGDSIHVVTSQEVIGETGDGITIGGLNSATDVLVEASGDVVGHRTGLSVVGGELRIVTKGSVTGTTQTGIKAESFTTAEVDIAGQVSGGNGTAIDMNTVLEEAVLVLRDGWGLSGQAVASVYDTDDVLMLSGATDSTIALSAIGNTADANGIIGFENFVKVGAGTWNLTGTQADGAFLGGYASEGTLVLENATFLMDASATPFFVGADAALGVEGESFFDGHILNEGTLTLQDGAADDRMTIGGDLNGNGRVIVDVDTAGDRGDLVILQGSSAGSKALLVNNLSPNEATGNDIQIVEVAGTSSVTDFVLSGGPVTAAAFDYDLVQRGGSFVLQAGLNGTGATYDAAPAVLSAFNRLPTLQQREQGRRAGGPSTGRGESSLKPWLRIEGDRASRETRRGTDIVQDQYMLQAGADFALDSAGVGQWVLGVVAHYGTVAGDVEAAFGSGRIDASGYGVGAAASWRGQQNYVDFQGQVSWIDSDYASSVGGVLASDRRSRAIALSIEAGRRYALGANRALVPQAQLTWGQVDSDSFTDALGNAVEFEVNTTLVARVGLAYEYGAETAGKNATSYYVIGNLLRAVYSDSSVRVGGADLGSLDDVTWGEVGFGGDIALSDGASLYGEASYRRAFGDTDGADHGFGLSAGLRMAF